MQLNYQISGNLKQGTIVLIHGLFGSLSNLGMIARHYQDQYLVVQIDIRNHGKSPHAEEMNFSLMVDDVLQTLDSLNIESFYLIGHSMGGKISMKMAEKSPERINKMIILDIAPYAYKERHHDEIFTALFAVQNAKLSSRQEATELMRTFLKEEMVVQFLMKSFNKGQWLFNLDAIYTHYKNILSWNDINKSSVQTLFIRGGDSQYLASNDKIDAIFDQFQNVEIQSVEGAGHWLHAQKTDQVLILIDNFLA